MPESTAAIMDSLVYELLVDPQIYLDGTTHVEVVETHLSWVFLTRTLAVKLKKPVRFEFVDFSKVEARRRACRAEVALNRRWSSGVYLNVVPITLTADGRLVLGGDGKPVDWIVKMRRLSSELQLSRIIQGNQPRLAERLDEVADHLVSAYAALTPVSLLPSTYLRRIRAHEDANAHDLLRLAEPDTRDQIQRVHNALLQFLWLSREVFETRVSGGCVVEGHGDLRPEHVFLESPIQIIDGLEFSEELRQNDVLDELSFFAMECDRLGASTFVDTFLDKYCKERAERVSGPLVKFYMAYRAVVRAKVAALRAAQLPARASRPCRREMRQYLTHADTYADGLGHPWVVATCGVMGSGKSTLSQAIASLSGAEVFSTDIIRRELLGASAAPSGFGEQHYTKQLRGEVYEELFRRTSAALDSRRTVVLDGTFLSRDLRRRAIDVAHRSLTPIRFVHCLAPRDVLLQRLTDRYADGTSPSEARPELLDYQVQEEESFVETTNVLPIDTCQPIAAQLESVRQSLRNPWRCR